VGSTSKTQKPPDEPDCDQPKSDDSESWNEIELVYEETDR
jgi:hypothetical protein